MGKRVLCHPPHWRPLLFEHRLGEVLEFERAKTARTKRKVEPIRVTITDEVNEIIKKWGNETKNGKTYIFPVLEAGLSPVRERQLIQQLTQVINCHMKIIAKTLNILHDHLDKTRHLQQNPKFIFISDVSLFIYC